MSLYVSWSCAHNARFGGKLFCNQGRVFQLANANCQIEAIANDVDHVIRDLEIQVDLRVLGNKVSEIGRDVQSAEAGRCSNLRLAAWCRIAPGHKILCLLDQAQDVNDALKVAFASFSQSEMVCCALKKPGSQTFFE